MGNRVLGNLIGVDVSGEIPLRNDMQGIALRSEGNTIGGHEAGAGNVIASNGMEGIDTTGDGNRVLGNAIGTNMDGALGLGNGRNGVRIYAGDDNEIGDRLGASMNTIAYNGSDGVAIVDSVTGNVASSNTVVRNLIFVNGTSRDDLGIDLADDDVTENDRRDGDAGPNGLQNHPVVTEADAAAGTVAWTFEGEPGTSYRLEFYGSTLCDGSGNGEGQRYLGSYNVETNGDGLAPGITATASPPAAGDHLTMTATRKTSTGPFPNPIATQLHETSEFSPCRVVG